MRNSYCICPADPRSVNAYNSLKARRGCRDLWKTLQRKKEMEEENHGRKHQTAAIFPWYAEIWPMGTPKPSSYTTPMTHDPRFGRSSFWLRGDLVRNILVNKHFLWLAPLWIPTRLVWNCPWKWLIPTLEALWRWESLGLFPNTPVQAQMPSQVPVSLFLTTERDLESGGRKGVQWGK